MKLLLAADVGLLVGEAHVQVDRFVLHFRSFKRRSGVSDMSQPLGCSLPVRLLILVFS